MDDYCNNQITCLFLTHAKPTYWFGDTAGKLLSLDSLRVPDHFHLKTPP